MEYMGTVGRQLDVPVVWSDYLAYQLGGKNVNLSNEGKDNNQIFNDTVQYLSDPTKKKPDVVVVQWTEIDRLCVFKKKHTDSWREIIKDRPHGNRFALPHWQKLSYKNHDNYPPEKQFKLHMWDGKDCNYKAFEYFSDDRVVEKNELLIKTFALQEITKSLGMKFIWYFMEDIRGVDQAVWDRIDYRNNCLIEDPSKSWGWYDHLEWCEYKPYDHFHFKIDAHKYTAKRLQKMIEENVQTVVEDVAYKGVQEKGRRVYRYIAEEE
tara:strand:+ start:1257 stop:2051 length:795 start_codon:yes stop_codon:yes gene_type:complete